MQNIRNRLPCFSHRRDDVYALAPVKMITAEESLNTRNVTFTPIPVEKEEIPYFVFEKYPVAKSTTFLETPSSIAFTNIRCVVPGRKFHFNFFRLKFIFLFSYFHINSLRMMHPNNCCHVT